jgi:porin
MSSLNRPARFARLAQTLPGAVIAVSLIAAFASPVAKAAGPQLVVPSADDTTNAPTQGSGPFGFVDGIWRSSNLLGDLFGVRPLLSKYGMTFLAQETSEVLGNVSGGQRKGFQYDGLTQMLLQLDTQRAFGWHGGTFNISAEQIHGRNLSTDNLGTLQTASGIEADRSTRLWELWYQQKFLEEDRLDIKIGQQSLDQEFMVSTNALYFVNTMFGWPMLPSADLPGGGPAYPLSALGIRMRAKPTDAITVLAGVFNGSPTGNSNGDPQQTNPSGTSFPLHNGQMLIAELQYAYPSLGTMVSPDEGEPLSRVYRLGAWYNTESFADQALDTLGQSLATPSSNGIPRRHHGDFAIYAVADQMVWRSPADPDRNVNVFFRAMGSPLTDRNLIDFSVNVGLTMHEPIWLRDDDTFAIGLGYAHVSNRAAALDSSTAAFSNSYNPVRHSETFIEATYQYQATPWLQLQPDVQYVFNPGAGISNPSNPGQTVKNELVLGVRTNILF